MVYSLPQLWFIYSNLGKIHHAKWKSRWLACNVHIYSTDVSALGIISHAAPVVCHGMRCWCTTLTSRHYRLPRPTEPPISNFSVNLHDDELEWRTWWFSRITSAHVCDYFYCPPYEMGVQLWYWIARWSNVQKPGWAALWLLLAMLGCKIPTGSTRADLAGQVKYLVYCN